MNYTLIIIDYFMQFIEQGAATDDALARAKAYCYSSFRERMKRNV